MTGKLNTRCRQQETSQVFSCTAEYLGPSLPKPRVPIFGDPGADIGGEGKSKRAEK